MTERTIIALHGFTAEQEAAIREAAPGWNVRFGRPKDFTPAELQEAEILCGWSPDYTEHLLRQPSKLRWVQLWSSGADYMPLDQLEQRGILLTDACHVHPVPMAETAIGMLLMLSRNLHHAVRRQSEAVWKSSPVYTELRGRTLAVIGAGAIGSEIARLAEAFGMQVIGVRRSGLPAPHVTDMYKPAQLDEVLALSDAVVNVLPLTAETEGLFDVGRFAAMKQGAWFVNVGRGKSVRTEALMEALRSGHLGGAGLDVFETEPLPPEHPLWAMDNVILTPHIGGDTDRLKERVAELFSANLRSYVEHGKPSMNLMDYKLGY
ncbi:D-2-hydroxyacid dehydrogenase [Paenibacillus gansuensis]|uniref:D-2-hydroxyacid dehydrogenase n=1 Tax=Paenibacillus gansuensis TaxID=306542 RepID=A0ABW5P9Y6_9BACL